MNTKLLLFVVVAFGTALAWAHDPFLRIENAPKLEKSAPKHQKYVPLPQTRRLSDFKENVDYEVGRVTIGEMSMPVTLSARPERNEHRAWIRSRYILTFHSSKGLGVQHKSRTAATMNFYIDEQNSIFKGILIHEDLRGKALLKPFFKFYALFVNEFKLGFSTEKMYKPLFAKLFMDFGFTPLSQSRKVRISRDRQDDGLLHIFPFGFDIKPKLVASQKMVVLEHPPLENFQDVYVNTEYFLSDYDDIKAFWEKIAAVKGLFVIYRND